MLLKTLHRRPGKSLVLAVFTTFLFYILFFRYSTDTAYFSKSAIVDASHRENYLFPQSFEEIENKANLGSADGKGEGDRKVLENVIGHGHQNSKLPSRKDYHNSKLINDYFLQLAKFQVDDNVIKDPENELEFADVEESPNFITLQYLQSIVHVPKKWIEEVKSKHQQVIQFLNKTIEEINNLNERMRGIRDDSLEIVNDKMFCASGNGAVMIGGAADDDTWLALISTRLFRKAGGVLPVEVMLPTKEDYYKDREICDKYLPQLNAKCVIIEELLNLQLPSNKEERGFVSKYIWTHFGKVKKEIAILLSSFEHVLYLTPQNVVLRPMEDDVFENQLYRDNGMFVWNDMRLRKTLSTFYEIAEIKIDKFNVKKFGLPLQADWNKESKQLTDAEIKTKVNFHDFAKTLPFKQSDASEVIIDKTKHLATLLLSLYYNLNGENVYYVLLSGMPHDLSASKETLTAAAHVLGSTYYSINTDADPNGYRYDNEFHGVSRMQYNPIVDYHSYNTYIGKFSDKQAKLTWENYQGWLQSSSERRSPLFLNINNPPLKPVELLGENVVRKENGDRVRLISPTSYFGGELESDIWRVMNDYICHLNLECEYVNRHFGRGKSGAMKQDFCGTQMKEHLLWIANSAW